MGLGFKSRQIVDMACAVKRCDSWPRSGQLSKADPLANFAKWTFARELLATWGVLLPFGVKMSDMQVMLGKS